MSNLIIQYLIGAFDENEHHRIVAELKVREEASLRAGEPEGYHYSIGLINGKDLVIGAPSKDLENQKEKVVVIHKDKGGELWL